MVDYIDNQVALHEVCKHYSLPADSSVRDFLMEHGSIAPVLLCAVPQVKRYFGANSDVRLKAPIDEALCGHHVVRAG